MLKIACLVKFCKVVSLEVAVSADVEMRPTGEGGAGEPQDYAYYQWLVRNGHQRRHCHPEVPRWGEVFLTKSLQGEPAASGPGSIRGKRSPS
jgi:hypothetical protein